jgi:lipopolysaccharide export system protein LptA
MNPPVVSGLFVVACSCALAAGVQAATPIHAGPVRIVAATAGDAPTPPVNTPPPAPAASAPPAPAASAPAPSPTSASRAHLHRPGTDVESDVLTGSLASQAYILKGNVTLQSDPKIDRDIAEVSESDEPLTLTADEIDVDKNGLTYVAKGNVHFVQGDRSGGADLATLDELTHSLDLVGNANVFEGDHRAAASKMHYDTLDKQFAGSGGVRIYEPLPTPGPSASGTPPPKHRRRLPF